MTLTMRYLLAVMAWRDRSRWFWSTPASNAWREQWHRR